MMKKLLFLPAALMAFTLVAQPTLQNNVLPSVGDVITRYNADPLSVDPGKAGANQVWDFSNLKPLADTKAAVYEFVTPASTPYASSFSAANLAYKTNAEQPTYAYYQQENNQLLLVGVVESSSFLEYDNPDLALQPLRFQEDAQRDFTCNVAVNGAHASRALGNRTINYDAYGTLKTPLGTFPNAMRVRYESAQIDTTPGKGAMIVNHTSSIIYSWYVAGHADALVSIYFTSIFSEILIPGLAPTITENPTIKGLNYISAVTSRGSNATEAPAGLTITALGPNPATEQLLLRFSMQTAGQSLQLLVTDATGKEVQHQTIQTIAGENTLALPVNRLTAGSYFLTLSDGQKKVTQAWVKQ